MIVKVNSMSIYVLNLESAISFYVDTLGFKVHTDIIMEPDSRWVSVYIPDEPHLQLMLIPVEVGTLFSGSQVKKMRELIQMQIFSYGVFKCKNLKKTCKLLESKGVKFLMKPGYGFLGQYEAAFLDDSGNWFRLTEDQNSV